MSHSFVYFLPENLSLYVVPSKDDEQPDVRDLLQLDTEQTVIRSDRVGHVIHTKGCTLRAWVPIYTNSGLFHTHWYPTRLVVSSI